MFFVSESHINWKRNCTAKQIQTTGRRIRLVKADFEWQYCEKVQIVVLSTGKSPVLKSKSETKQYIKYYVPALKEHADLSATGRK